MKENRTLGNVIADFRKLKKIPQREMAIDLRISLKKMREIENINISGVKDFESVKKDADLIKRIADYFEIPVSTLFFSLLGAKDYETPRGKPTGYHQERWSSENNVSCLFSAFP